MAGTVAPRADNGVPRRGARLSDRSEIIAAMTDTADQIVGAWARLAADTTALDGAPDLRAPGGRDWARVLLVERFRAGIGTAVVEILQRELPLPAAGLAVRPVIRACNEAYAVISQLAAAVGGGVDVERSVAEAEPALRAAVERAIERAVARG
jgi:hypothetical protein